MLLLTQTLRFRTYLGIQPDYLQSRQLLLPAVLELNLVAGLPPGRFGGR
jgi:hypothetical protein